MRLDGTLNQIRLQCPGRMMDQEVQQHLKDCLFHVYVSTLETQYGTYTAIPGPPIPNS